jgi:hypothetical protein
MQRTVLVAFLFCFALAQAKAAELRVGLSAETTSLYPNWFVTTGNQQIACHIFDNLVEMDANSIPQPGLAESWSPNPATVRHGHAGPGLDPQNDVADTDQGPPRKRGMNTGVPCGSPRDTRDRPKRCSVPTIRDFGQSWLIFDPGNQWPMRWLAHAVW